jgi:hypothetical protein
MVVVKVNQDAHVSVPIVPQLRIPHSIRVWSPAIPLYASMLLNTTLVYLMLQLYIPSHHHGFAYGRQASSDS